MGTLTVLRPLDRMMDSFETIEPRFFLIASLMRSLWRSWSMTPLRWSDQSLRWTDITNTSLLLAANFIKLPGRRFDHAKRGLGLSGLLQRQMIRCRDLIVDF